MLNGFDIKLIDDKITMAFVITVPERFWLEKAYHNRLYIGEENLQSPIRIMVQKYRIFIKNIFKTRFIE